MKALSIKEAKNIDMISYLESLNHFPTKQRGNDYWFLSPLRQEKTPSFKVDRKLNIWYDHGIGKGGNLLDFGILYCGCSVSELLSKLWHFSTFDFSFHPQPLAGEKKEEPAARIVVLDTRPISNFALRKYLHDRQIAEEIAQRFCVEIDFSLNEKKFFAIGFKNNSGGYEIRNEFFKASSSPKDFTFIDNGSNHVSVFEGFFSFLSLLSVNQNPDSALTNFLVLNSLSFFEKAKAQLEIHDRVNLFLDRDDAGNTQTKQAILLSSKYVDRSDFYEGLKDLNEWLVDQERRQNQTQKLGRHL